MWIWIVRILRWIVFSLIWKTLKTSGIGLSEITTFTWEQIKNLGEWYDGLKEPGRFYLFILVSIILILAAALGHPILKTISLALLLVVIVKTYMSQLKEIEKGSKKVENV